MAVSDAELLHTFEQRHGAHLALARRFVGEDDALDVVQESYVRAWRALPRFRGDAALSTWLHTIVSNTARTWSMRRRPTASLDEVPDLVDRRPSADPAHRLAEVADASSVLEVLYALPPSLRDVAVPKLVHGLAHERIAADLGITVAATKVRLHRARRLLQAALAPARLAADDRAA